MRFKEPIQAMRARIEQLNGEIRNLETGASGNAELRRRIIEGVKREILEFESAIDYLQRPIVKFPGVMS